MKEIFMEATTRTASGKGVARKLRAAKKIPAVVYGRGEQPLSLEINYNHFHAVYHGLHGENALINLQIDGKPSEKKAVIRDIQHDPVEGDILHIDFQHISMDQKIRLSVPVRLIGTADGVKNFSGILQWTFRDLEVLCYPDKIPESITINIEPLNIGDAVHVKDLSYPDVEFLDDEHETIVNVIAPKIVATTVEAGAEGEAVAEAAPAATEAEPEIISEKKAEERQAEKAKRDKEK